MREIRLEEGNLLHPLVANLVLKGMEDEARAFIVSVLASTLHFRDVADAGKTDANVTIPGGRTRSTTIIFAEVFAQTAAEARILHRESGIASISRFMEAWCKQMMMFWVSKMLLCFRFWVNWERGGV